MLRRATIRCFSSAPGVGQSAYFPVHKFSFDTPTELRTKLHPSDVGAAEDFEQFKKMVTNPGPIEFCFSRDYLDWYWRAYSNRVNSLLADAKANMSAKRSSMKMKPTHSKAAVEATSSLEESRSEIDKLAVKLGMLDVWERKEQIPFINIDRCDSGHLRAILEEHFVDEALSATELWNKAIGYAALLKHRKQSYPPYWKATLDAADQVKQGPSDGTASHLPGKSLFEFYEKLVQRFDIQNGLELHVALRAQQIGALEHYLHSPVLEAERSNTKPEDQGKGVTVELPHEPMDGYPELSALFHEDNIPLMRCLVSGDWNTWVLSPKLFTKFPNARGLVTKPAHSHPKDVVTRMLEKRNELGVVPLTEAESRVVDQRSRDIQAFSARASHHDSEFARTDIAGMQGMSKHAAAIANESHLFNPKQFRAEVRDGIYRRMEAALEKFKFGKQQQQRPVVGGGEKATVIPFDRPTVWWFARLLRSDAHIACCIALSSQSALIESKIRDAAEIMFNLALEYGNPAQRQLNVKKVRLALTLLDDVVGEALTEVRSVEGMSQEQSTIPLLDYVPWASRHLTEYGFPTEARFDDYRRWTDSYVVAPSQ